MKKLLSSLLAVAMVPLFIAADTSDASAWQPGPRVYRPSVRGFVPGYRPIYRNPGYRFYGPRYVPAPVFMPAPVYVPTPRTVIVERPVMVRPAPAPAPVVVERPVETVMAEPARRDLIAVGLHASAVGTSGEKVGLSTAENPAMGGVGVHVKGRFDESWGLELSADFLTGDATNADLTQSTIPVMAAVTWHILPNSRFQPYLLAGAGVHFTRLSYFGNDYAIDVTEFAGQLGGGLEVFITENLALSADLRFNTVFKNLDQRESVHTDCLRQTGNMTGFCDNIHYTGAEDKVNLGAQFKVGASWYF
jgi:opacity protein-like surface antigen